MMQLFTVSAVLLLFLSCCASSIEQFGSEAVRALMREGARPRPASDVARSFLSSRNDEPEPDFDSTRPRMTFEEYLPHKRDSLKKSGSEDLETLDLMLRELEDDAAGCRDKEQFCEDYYESKECWNPEFKHYMQTNCAKTCGYCECYDKRGTFKYGCCTNDNKVPAEGYNKEGCSKKLCVDLSNTCQKRKALCKVADKREEMERQCSYTCEYCDTNKAASPQIACESRDNPPAYGCCWDGSEALGPNQKGCPVCADSSPACKRFSLQIDQFCNSPFYNRRKFADGCPQSCKRCHGCSNLKGTKYCEYYKAKGDCSLPYMAIACKRTCGKCGK